jgi:stage III sporulation protein AE
MDHDWQENLSELLDTGTQQIKSVTKRAVRSGVLLLVIVMLCSLGDGMTLAGGDLKVPVVTLAGTLAVAAVAVTDIYSLMGLGTEAIESMTTFSNVLLPIVATVTAATGAITGAAARQMAAALFSGLLVNLISKLLIPLVYGYIAAQVAYSAVGNAGLKRVAAFFKWLTVSILTVILLAYVGYLTISGVMTGSADGATVKAAKVAISGAVPVVGGILADASESVLAAAGILRGTVGVFGMIVVLAICLVPFLQLAIHYLIYKLASALAATVGEGRVCGLIEDLGGAFGLILGMMGSCALLLLVSLVSSITAVVT